MQKRRNILAGLFGVLGASKAVNAASAESSLERQIFEIPLIFTQRDTVVDFSPSTGLGLQVGTVQGLISGTSMTCRFANDYRRGLTVLVDPKPRTPQTHD